MHITPTQVAKCNDQGNRDFAQFLSQTILLLGFISPTYWFYPGPSNVQHSTTQWWPVSIYSFVNGRPFKPSLFPWVFRKCTYIYIILYYILLYYIIYYYIILYYIILYYIIISYHIILYYIILYYIIIYYVII
jgi:hypothetical protein